MDIIGLIFSAAACLISIIILIKLFAKGNNPQEEIYFNEIQKNINLLRDNIESRNRMLIEDLKASQREQNNILVQQIHNLTQSNNTLMNEIRETLLKQIDTSSTTQQERLRKLEQRVGEMSLLNEQRLENIRKVVEDKLTLLQQDNSKKLDQMRQTVDEKLNETLNKRLGESFELVNIQLKQVHEGLGEMSTLAQGVGDLKKIMSNVKQRGVWGEMLLEAQLEQILAPNQYESNVCIKPGSQGRVEFAIKIPMKDDFNSFVYLPVDSKFPTASYLRLVDAYSQEDPAQITAFQKELTDAIKTCAKTISEKYIHPPYSTEYAILYLPTESLYAEVAKQHGLIEMIQSTYQVTIAGPTTFSALLTSLQMGFRAVAIQNRSKEIWTLLGAIKKEFGTFTGLLEKTQRRLRTSAEEIDRATNTSRRIQTRLEKVESLPEMTQETLIIEDQDIAENS